MKIGMLWFDNDPQEDIPAKILRAATYYRKKYGKNPTLCFVHPSMLRSSPAVKEGEGEEDEPGLVAAGVEVRANQTILPNHFWIGLNGKSNGDIRGA
jgi:hypothetical protein